MTYLTQAVVLRRDHLSDNDRRYVIYTHDFGKINAVIKGAKKITSKLNSHLDYFCISNLMLAKGTSFERIASARLNCKFKTIAPNLYKSSAAFYFCEVVDALIKYSLGDGQTFATIVGFYQDLEGAADKSQVLSALNKGCYELLKRLGYQPIIVSRNQRELLKELNQRILEAGEKEIRSFGIIRELFV